MKFDIKLAIRGVSVITENELSVRILDYSLKGSFPIVAAITENDVETIKLFTKDGICENANDEYNLKLKMNLKKEYYVTFHSKDGKESHLSGFSSRKELDYELQKAIDFFERSPKDEFSSLILDAYYSERITYSTSDKKIIPGLI